MEILGIDGGNANVKVACDRGVYLFSSAIGEYRERHLHSRFGPDDMVWEYNGRRGFAGTLAKMESELSGSRKGISKAHVEAKLRILLAIHQYAVDQYVSIVVGQPVETHTTEEKQKIKDMLLGPHTLTVNGVQKSFVVNKCEVGVEGGSSSLSDPRMGLQRYIDIGSGSINFATTYDMTLVDRDSFTEDFGMETLRTNDTDSIARRICVRALEKWQPYDPVRVLGGGAETILDGIKAYFPKSELMHPKITIGNQLKIVKPIFANAIGNYEIGCKVYAANH